MAFEYFYGREADKFMFIRIPKLMFELEGIKDIPVESKVMYGLLLDRVGLSAENGWHDDKGRVYIIYRIEDAARTLGCSPRKAQEIIRILEEKGLIEKKRQGMGRPNLIYVKNFLTEQHDLPFKNSRTCHSGCVDSAVQDRQDMPANNTNKSNTEISNTDNNPIRLDMQDSEMEERELYKEIVKDNIHYDDLVSEHPLQRDISDQIIDLMVDVMCSTESRIRIGGDEKPRQIVKSMFSKLGQEHIEYVLDCLKKNDKEIRNVRQYLISALYNAPMTMAAYKAAQNNRQQNNYEYGGWT